MRSGAVKAATSPQARFAGSVGVPQVGTGAGSTGIEAVKSVIEPQASVGAAQVISIVPPQASKLFTIVGVTVPSIKHVPASAFE